MSRWSLVGCPVSSNVVNTLEKAPFEASDRIAIVVAAWNRSITSKLLDGALQTLTAAGVGHDQVDVAWVPGAWEIPVVAQRFAQTKQYGAVISLGAVIRGETTHDQHINRAVSLSLQQIALASDVPMVFGILTCESMEQAIHRAGGNVGNKGCECAEAALHMIGLLKNCPPR